MATAEITRKLSYRWQTARRICANNICLRDREMALTNTVVGK